MKKMQTFQHKARKTKQKQSPKKPNTSKQILEKQTGAIPMALYLLSTAKRLTRTLVNAITFIEKILAAALADDTMGCLPDSL